MSATWTLTTLGAIAQVGAGNSAPQGDVFFADGTHPFFRTSDAGRVRFGDIDESTDYLNDIGIKGLRRFPAGTILFPKSGASTFLNHRVLLGVEGYVSSHLATIVGDETKVNRRFLLYLLRTIHAQDLIQDHAYPSLNLPMIAGIPVMLPPLPEQQRIVALLDEAFDGIATAHAHTEKNLQNARTIFKSHLQSLFSQQDENWSASTLGNVCQFENGDRGKNYPNRAEYVDSGVPWINTGHIKPDGTLSASEMNFITQQKYDSLRSGKIKPGDLVYCLRGATLGKTAFVAPFTTGAVASSLVIIRPGKAIDGRFLYYFLTSPIGQGLIKQYENGAAQPNLGAKSVAAFRILLPSLIDQSSLIQRLDDLAAETQRLESLYQRKLAALDALKKSLLHQAFSGQLTSAKPTGVSLQAAIQTTTPEFTANVISFAYERHKRKNRENTFGHVKEQKVLHLVESIAGIELGRQPMKDAAGPNDFPHMLKAEEWAKVHGFFEVVKRDRGYDFKKLSKYDEHLSRARQALAPYLPQLESVIDLLVPMDTEEAEVFATVHAAWNNLLKDGMEVTDDAIVWAAREGWHADKLKIPEHKFRTAIVLIRQKNLVPDGTTRYVGNQQRLI